MNIGDILGKLQSGILPRNSRIVQIGVSVQSRGLMVAVLR